VTDLSAAVPATLAANWIVPLVATEVELADTVTEVTDGVAGEPPEGVVGVLNVFAPPPPQAAIHRAAMIGAKRNRSSGPRSLREAFIYSAILLFG
jgi:hypothetical protein